MAPRGPAKAREYDYSNVGKAGRRTGITLAEGKRDEHGMEEIEGMFSSPEKSPTKENGFGDDGDETSMGSDGMSLDEGNGPGPADFLNGGRGSYFPPPVARSPLKTGLTGSPRRTPGLRLSASPQRQQPLSSPSDGKGLNNAKGESRRDASPLANRSANAQFLNNANSLLKGKGSSSKAPEPAPAVNFSDSDGESQVNGDENADSFEEIQPDFGADNFAEGDETMMSDQAAQVDDEPDQNDDADLEGPSIMSPEPREAEQPKATPPKAKPAPKTINRTQETTTQPNRINEQEAAPKPRRPGRPPKAQRKDNEDTGEQRPAKKAKTLTAAAAAAEQTSREVRTTGDPEIDHIVEDYASRKGGSKARSLHVLKREKLSENSLATTRSGRTVVKPLAFWKNEKCLFGEEGISEGRWIPCSTMTGVLRAEEEESEKKSGKGRGRPKKSKKSKDVESDDEEEDEDVDDWEQEGGVLHGYIRKWDAEIQAGVEEEEVLDIAYAPSGIETKDVKDSTFRFAKLLSSPFLGSGIVELPPGGVKRPKNSKKMHMVFYVCQGRVQIDISGVQFSAGKGCVFQIPRGNYYSFANAHGHDVRLFFTQGCVPEEEGPAPDELKQTALEAESATEAGQDDGGGGAPPPRGKGRPKGSKGKGKGPRQNA